MHVATSDTVGRFWQLRSDFPRSEKVIVPAREAVAVRVTTAPLVKLPVLSESVTVVGPPAAAMRMATVSVSLPAELVAVTTKFVCERVEVGVPEITPVSVEKLTPVGSVGEIDHDVAVPPEFDGVSLVIASLMMPVYEVGE